MRWLEDRHIGILNSAMWGGRIEPYPTQELRDRIEEWRSGPIDREVANENGWNLWTAPQGWVYAIVQTDCPVKVPDNGVMREFYGPFARLRALHFANKHIPPLPSYRVEIVRGGPMQWSAVAMQNLLREVKVSRSEMRRAMQTLVGEDD